MNVEELKAALVGTWTSLAPEVRPSKNPNTEANRPTNLQIPLVRAES